MKYGEIVPLKTEEEMKGLIEKIYKLMNNRKYGHCDKLNLISSMFTTELMKLPYNERITQWTQVQSTVWDYLESHPEQI